MSTSNDLNNNHSQLTNDVFDQIKKINGLQDIQHVLDRERKYQAAEMQKFTQTIDNIFNESLKVVNQKLETLQVTNKNGLNSVDGRFEEVELRMDTFDNFRKNPVALLKSVDYIRQNQMGACFFLQFYFYESTKARLREFGEVGNGGLTPSAFLGAKYDTLMWVFRSGPIMLRADFLGALKVSRLIPTTLGRSFEGQDIIARFT